MLKRFVQALVLIVAGVAGPAQAADTGGGGYWSNQTPYGNPSSTLTVAPPGGYEMTFIETIGRHGSRTRTNTAVETAARKVWESASKKKALTTAGKRFSSDLEAFQKAEKAIGFGNLTKVGLVEWAGIGKRTAANYEQFFQDAKAAHDPIEFVTSPVYRTKQSAKAMKARIALKVPGLTYAQTIDEARLVLTKGSTSAGEAAIAKVRKLAAVRKASISILKTLYTAKFVASLKDPVSAAMDIYMLYCTGPAMVPHTSVNFARYVSVSNARTLSQVKDSENFYRFGPGVAGQSNSYRKAKPLLNDFFSRLDARVAGGKTAAVFRLAHGETTMPFAALIKAPRSEVQTAPGVIYSFANPWRGSVAGLPAGSVEWVAYAKPGQDVLVTMRYNEKPVAFRDGCDPVEPYFYTVDELKACLL